MKRDRPDFRASHTGVESSKYGAFVPTEKRQIIDRQQGRVSLDLPFASPIVQTLARFYVFSLSLVPGTLLDLVGYDYSSIGGSQITKIHPSTYFVVLLSIVFIFTYPNRRALFSYYLSEKLGSLFFLAGATTALVNIIVGKRNGFGMCFDTDLNVFLCSMLLPFLTPATMNRLETYLHGFFLIDGILAISELGTGWHPFPLTTYSPDGFLYQEPRATAFFGHPLFGATMTCVYIISLLLGMGSFKREWMRPASVALQCLALTAFGGRSAFALTMAFLWLMLIWRFMLFLRGAKLPYEAVILAALAPLVGVLGLAAAFTAGMLDSFIERFIDDGGSARTRLLMWPLLMSFRWGDMLWGAPTDYVFAQVISHGLEWGVENPFMHMAVYQGVIIATIIMSGILLTLYENYQRLDPKSFFAIAVFMLLCNGFGSLGGRFYTFAFFVVVIGVLYRRRSATRVI